MLLSARELHAAFGAVTALDGVDVDVDDGEVVALLGANGAGKSTLLRVVAGLVRPRGGSVAWEGARIDGEDAAARVRRGIALVPEGGGVLARLTVEENLRIGASTLDRDAVAMRRDEVLTRFPLLAELRGRTAGSLSGGEQRQVAVGRALMSRPRLLLVDELSLGLAPLAFAALTAVLREVAAAGTAVLLVEQRVEQALRLAERGYVLDRGRVVLSGTAGELRADHDALRTAYLGAAGRAEDPAPASAGRPRECRDGGEAERLVLPLGNRVRRGLQELADAAGTSPGAYAAGVIAAHVNARATPVRATAVEGHP